MSSSFGSIFRVTTYGESHGESVGVIVDGCPPRLAIDVNQIQAQLDRRRPGQSRLTSDRDEKDRVTILSGVEQGLTLGTPIALSVANQDQRPGDYAALTATPRPSHGDYTYQEKYGIRSASGGGRASARETIGRVAGGAVAEKLLLQDFGVEVVAWVSAVEKVSAPEPDLERVTRQEVDRRIVRCPHGPSAEEMTRAIDQAKNEGDSVGGIITGLCRGVPPGWGEPVFAKMEALLAQAMLSIPAAKGFEIGSGFAGTALRGSAHNDAFVKKGDRLGTRTNRSGGIQAGISNGEPVLFRVAFKPPATIGLPQKTANFNGTETEMKARGRHDPCVVPRAVPIVESMAALVLADLALRQKTRL